MTAKKRRRLYGIALILWGTVGAAATVVFRDAVWWLQFMSWAALMVGLFGAYSGETPVENQENG